MLVVLLPDYLYNQLYLKLRHIKKTTVYFNGDAVEAPPSPGCALIFL
jgi:hypothetical protein